MGRSIKYSRPVLEAALARNAAGETWVEIADSMRCSCRGLRHAITAMRRGNAPSEVSSQEEWAGIEGLILKGIPIEEIAADLGWCLERLKIRCTNMGCGATERQDIRIQLGLEPPRPAKPAPPPPLPLAVRIRQRAEEEARRTAYPLEVRKLRRRPTRCIAA